MGDDAEYYFETMMEDPEFRENRKSLKRNAKQKKDLIF